MKDDEILEKAKEIIDKRNEALYKQIEENTNFKSDINKDVLFSIIPLLNGNYILQFAPSRISVELSWDNLKELGKEINKEVYG